MSARAVSSLAPGGCVLPERIGERPRGWGLRGELPTGLARHHRRPRGAARAHAAPLLAGTSISDSTCEARRGRCEGPGAGRGRHQGVQCAGGDSDTSVSEPASAAAEPHAAEVASSGSGRGEEGGPSLGAIATVAGPSLLVAGMALLLGLGYVFKDDIKQQLELFSALVEVWGPWGYVAFAGAYVVLEVLAVPAVPLTMASGVLFGPVAGTAVVSVSATTAAALAFLIARYVARDKIAQLVTRNAKFAAIDRAIGKDSFKIVLLLRLSPLLPFALSNYLYGLTSVEFTSYVVASWLGMLPGTFAYVSAGSVGRTVLEQTSGASASASELLPLIFGVVGTLGATTYISRVVMKSLKEVDVE